MSETQRKIIRFPEVKRITGYSRVTIWRRVRAGTFPAPVQCGPNSIGWFEDEVEAHQAHLPRVSYAPIAASPEPAGVS